MSPLFDPINLRRLQSASLTLALTVLAASAHSADRPEAFSPTADGAAAKPVPLIYETDISGDCDDVGALAMIHTLIDRGEADLLMVGINRDEPNRASAAAVDAINTHYGRGDVPIGTSHAQRAQTPRESTYAPALRDEFPHDARPDPEMPDAVDLYRKTLAAAADGSVVIASVGGTTNLAELLASPPDSRSELAGRDLVAAKVRLLVQMAAQFPTSRIRRAEANMLIDPPGNAALTQTWPTSDAAGWPTPIVWSGWEVGADIRTGQPLASLPEDHPVRRAYALHPGGGAGRSSLEGGRPSWDQTAVLYAVRGAGDLWALERGRIVLGEENRHNDWQSDPEGTQAYLVSKQPPETIAAVIDTLMLGTP